MPRPGRFAQNAAVLFGNPAAASKTSATLAASNPE
jgi:hypothetical protein